MEHQENLGEVLFVNETTLTKKYLQEFLRRVNRRNIPFTVLLAFCFVYNTYQVFRLIQFYHTWHLPLLWSEIDTAVIYSLLCLLFFLLYWQLPRINTWLRFRRLKTYAPTATLHSRYLFGEQITVLGDDNRSQIAYEQISKIIPTSFGCALVVAKASGLLIDKDGFTQGTYADFCRFLQEKCVNLNKKPQQVTPPQPQQSYPVPNVDAPPASFVNETTVTQEMLVHYYNRANRVRIPLALVYSLLSIFVIRQLFTICLLAIESPVSVSWWSIPLLVVCTIIILLATIYYWCLPRIMVRKSIKNHRLYHSGPCSTTRYSFGEQITIQTKNTRSVSEYQEISKIIDTDFGCAIVMAKTVAFLISAQGFTQGSYNEFRQFLSAKCPHLNKNRKS